MPFSDNKIAIQRVERNCANTIINITVSGAARNAPATPQIAPHRAKASKTTTAERFRDCPVMRGCTMFPIVNCQVCNPAATRRTGVKVLNCTSANAVGSATATTEPMVGI